MSGPGNGFDPLVLDYVVGRLHPAPAPTARPPATKSPTTAAPALPAPAGEAGRPVLATSAATFRPVGVAEPAIATRVKFDPVMLATATKARTRPAFVDLHVITQLPILHFPVLPPPSPTTPIQAGDVWLWPDGASRTAYFLLSMPERAEFDLVIEQDHDFSVTGGAATLVAGVFPATRTPAQTEAWIDQLRRFGIDASAWRFEPLALNRLDAVLELPTGHADGDGGAGPRVTTNPHLGTAIFLVRLTPLGAQVWRQALAGGAPPPGVCRLTAWYVGGDPASHLAARTQSIDATLASLTAGVRPEAVRILNPEIGVDATLRIDGDPTIEAITVEMRALNGTVRTATFGADGGTVTMRMVSDNPRAERVDWTARVVFAAASWPPMRVAGTLSDTTGWSELLAPSSWLRSISLTTMLIGGDGGVLTSTGNDPGNRVTGAIDFTAPFLEGATSLHTAFATSSQESTTVLVPRPPAAPVGALKLTVFALRDGRDDMVVRDLAFDEEWILIKVYLNARIEIQTNRSPGSESSREEAAAAAARALTTLGGG